MAKTKVHITSSLDGFVAGPNQSEEEPLGEGGEELHEWMIKLKAWRESHGMEGGDENASSEFVADLEKEFGAVIMGRNMFGPIGGGPWKDDSWKGWWGDNPPYHSPVYVLTHHEREPVEMQGGTTFYFVTDGIESAHAKAQEAAGDQDVLVTGGASAVNQFLAAGLIDEITINVVPQLLGSGERLLEGVGPDIKLEQLRAVEAPGVAHLSYRVVK
jgi:dihydrofolate reductase